MFVNLHTLPVGQHLFTLAVTNQPGGTPEDELFVDEIDIVAKRNSTVAELVAAVSPEEAADYEGCRVIGVADQSDGYLMFENPSSDITIGAKA